MTMMNVLPGARSVRAAVACAALPLVLAATPLARAQDGAAPAAPPPPASAAEMRADWERESGAINARGRELQGTGNQRAMDDLARDYAALMDRTIERGRAYLAASPADADDARAFVGDRLLGAIAFAARRRDAAAVERHEAAFREVEPDGARDRELLPAVGSAFLALAPERAVTAYDEFIRRFGGIDLPDTAGQTIRVGDYRGRVLLIDFWATWCGPCRRELPTVRATYERLHASGFEVLGVSLDSNRQALDQFVASERMTWRQHFDGRGWQNAVAQMYGVHSIPQTFLVDRAGRLRYVNLRGERLPQAVEELLAEQAPAPPEGERNEEGAAPSGTSDASAPEPTAEDRVRAEELLAEARRLSQARRYAEAIQKLDLALRWNPASAVAYHERGGCRLRIGEFIPAILDMSRALELDSAYFEDTFNRIYQVSYVVDLARVIRDLDRLVEQHPLEAHIVFLRGFMRASFLELPPERASGEAEPALADVERALELNTMFVAAHLLRGSLLTRGGRCDEALSSFARADALHPAGWLAAFFRAEALAGAGRDEEALLELKFACDHGLTCWDRVRASPAFERLRGDSRFQELMRGR